MSSFNFKNMQNYLEKKKSILYTNPLAGSIDRSSYSKTLQSLVGERSYLKHDLVDRNYVASI